MTWKLNFVRDGSQKKTRLVSLIQVSRYLKILKLHGFALNTKCPVLYKCVPSEIMS